jgi:periplasmic divalent cation tolerance protein
MTGCVVGMVTCSSRAEARRIAKALLDRKLAACVSIAGGVESRYWWRGKQEQAKEVLLLVKTTRAKSRSVIQTVKMAHSYDVPEIIFLPVVAGERRYLRWIRGSVAALMLMFATSAVRADRVEDLIRQLGSANEEIRAEAAEVLTQIGGARVEQKFREMIESGNAEHRQLAVVGLLQVSDAEADAERVQARLKDESATVRWSAALALGQSGRVESIPALEQAAGNDESESVREAAAEAVAKLRAGIRWSRSLADALREARELGKPVLAYFFVRGSEYCDRLEQGVLADKAVVDAAQEFVCARVNAAGASDARKHDVRGAPTILVLDGRGNEMSRVTGLVEKGALLGKLAEARRGKLTFREAHRLALRDASNVPANWKVAETYLEEGREDLAEPFLRNVVAHDEGNRLGHTDNAMFALGFCYGKRGQHAQSAYCMERLLQRWPEFKDKDKALYCLGLSQIAVGKKDAGRATLEQLVREFPASATVEPANKALEKLEGK